MNNKIKIFIIASILLNILLGGMLAGHLLRVAKHRDHLPPLYEETINIEKAKLEKFRKVLHNAHLNNRDLYEKIRETRNKALEILTDETFDEFAYQKHVEILHGLRGQMMQRFANAVKKLAMELTSEDRADLAEILRHPPPPQGHRPTTDHKDIAPSEEVSRPSL